MNKKNNTAKLLSLITIFALITSSCGTAQSPPLNSTTSDARATEVSDGNSQVSSVTASSNTSSSSETSTTTYTPVFYQTATTAESQEALSTLSAVNATTVEDFSATGSDELMEKLQLLEDKAAKLLASLYTEDQLQTIEVNQEAIRLAGAEVYIKSKSIGIGISEIYTQGETLTAAQLLQIQRLVDSYEALIAETYDQLAELKNDLIDGFNISEKQAPSYETIIASQENQLSVLGEINRFLDEVISILDINVIMPGTSEKATTLKSNYGLIAPTEKVRVGKDFVIDGIEALSPVADVNDPGFTYQWGLAYIHAPEAWTLLKDQTENLPEIKIAILDTGIDASHEDLIGRVDMASGYDFVNMDDDPSDDNGHGTHVAGIIAANANNASGIVGTVGSNPVSLIPIKILDSNGAGTLENVIKGIDLAIDLNVDIINLSIGMQGSNSDIEAVLQRAQQAGITLVVAAGNDSQNCDASTLTSSSATITISAVSPLYRKTSFSNYGETIDLASPGKKILSTVPGNQYEAWDGTSMATPMITGVVALIKMANPSLTTDEINSILKASAYDLLEEGPDDYTGAGLVNAYQALMLALEE